MTPEQERLLLAVARAQRLCLDAILPRSGKEYAATELTSALNAVQTIRDART